MQRISGIRIPASRSDAVLPLRIQKTPAGIPDRGFDFVVIRRNYLTAFLAVSHS